MNVTDIKLAEPVAGAVVLALLVSAMLLAKRPSKKYYERNKFVHPLTRFIEDKPYMRRRGILALELLMVLLFSLAVASPTISYTVTKTVEKQAATQLRVPPRPALVIIIDTSGSMSGWKIEAAKQAIERLVEKMASLNKTVDIGLISFSHIVKLAIPPTDNVSEILRAIKELRAGGGTMYTYPLMTAYNWLSLYRHFNQTAIIVFATDGLPADREQYREVLKRLAAMGVKIYTVFIGRSPEGRRETEYMARLGHGKSYTAARATELVKVFEEIANQASKTLMNVSVSAKLTIRITKEKQLSPYLYAATVLLLAVYATLWHRELGLAV